MSVSTTSSSGTGSSVSVGGLGASLADTVSLGSGTVLTGIRLSVGTLVRLGVVMGELVGVSGSTVRSIGGGLSAVSVGLSGVSGGAVGFSAVSDSVGSVTPAVMSENELPCIAIAPVPPPAT
ncbi:MAG: hypothetical protein AAGG56_03220 [Pseudomonadota bacterium]